MSAIHQCPPQPQQQPPLFAPHPSHTNLNPLSISSGFGAKRDLPIHNAQGRGHTQVPQRYAHPVQRNLSFTQQRDSNGDSYHYGDRSEHMLRRKTPNGILPAAYDGTSVEQMDKPHAMKHILLPVTASVQGSEGVSQTPCSFNSDLSVGASSASRISNSSSTRPHPPQGYIEQPPQARHEQANDVWSHPRLDAPQIDSLLDQVPMPLSQFPYLYMGQPFSGGMEPSFQTYIGPTVSNDQGPYGPYWPNGTYIPYRPAALRDPRFYPPSAHHWTTPSQSGWPAYTNAVPHSFIPPQYAVHGTGQLMQQGHFSTEPAPFEYFPGMGLRGNLPNHTSQHSGDLLQNRPSQGANASFAARAGLQVHEGYSPMSSSSSSNPLLLEFGPHSTNAQLRERVFSWAHSIYIDLLRYLQHTRKAASSSRGPNGALHPPRPTIYPKPPRQPTATFLASTTQQQSETQTPSAGYFPGNASNHFANSVPPTLGHSNFPDRSSPFWPSSVAHGDANHNYKSWQQHMSTPNVTPSNGQGYERIRTLRRTSGNIIASSQASMKQLHDPSASAAAAVDALTKLCDSGSVPWIDGMLLTGCLVYALGNYTAALEWYSRILKHDTDHVEAISNLAATLLALNRRQEAEQHWFRAVKLRPSFFEAVEHLIGLLCGDHRGKEAVQVIEHVERSLKISKAGEITDHSSEHSGSPGLSDASDKPVFDYEGENDAIFKDLSGAPGADQPGFGTSGYAIPGSDNGRILALVHAKGNMLYALGNNVAAAKAFENAVMIAAGWGFQTIGGLIDHILTVVHHTMFADPYDRSSQKPSSDPILLDPNQALETARLCFPSHGELPGLKYISGEGMARRAAVSTTSNSLLSLAKIFQDGMATNATSGSGYQSSIGVREILALYYLSLSLQPSPSTANNVGILLAGVQQSVPSRRAAMMAQDSKQPLIPGVVPGSGVALALSYYNYGLQLDPRHAHLFTNLGSLFKDIGQLNAAIKMYEQAVQCDANFDIALANLANAVKDQGRIADAITYYKRAVQASPDFAEAVCGLTNALNSVCDWRGRGGIAADSGQRDKWHVDEKGMLLDARLPGAVSSGWIKKVIDLVEKQLADGEEWGKGTITAAMIDEFARQYSIGSYGQVTKSQQRELRSVLSSWAGQKREGARIVRLIERAIKRLGWVWYQDKFVKGQEQSPSVYRRPRLPSTLSVPSAPTVLPFHTFTCPMSAKQIRLISQRNGLRISVSTLKAPWLPEHVFPPPPPPNPYLKVGYVSSDFNNHPLAHLMQSVFGLHNPTRVKAYCYATTASDNSVHRHQIEREAPVFYDASAWSAERLVRQIVQDGIHILVNLNGYTRGARNEIFAARAAPIQMSFMGFAGTLGTEWCDYLLADTTAVPPDTLRPWRRNIDMEDQLVKEDAAGDPDDWVYAENIVYCRDTFFCCDHRQSAPDAHGNQLSWEEEQVRRWKMRKEIFPNLSDDAIILGNFNQLYKIEPTTFRTWLRILARVPNAILWLLRFPDLGESHLKATARAWASEDVANRVIFTEVAPKHMHISRARVCDLFLDTPECNAHTTAADVLWSGTPLLTLPRYPYKMCSRMAASILQGALPKTAEGDRAARELIVPDEAAYEARAVEFARGARYEGHRITGRLGELRKLLYEARWTSALFDTRRWVRDLEEAYDVAWYRWEKGEGGDIWLQPQRDQGV